MDGVGGLIDEGEEIGVETNGLEVGRLVDLGVLEGEDVLVVFQLLDGNNFLIGERGLDMANVEAPKIIHIRFDRAIILERFQNNLYMVSDMRLYSRASLPFIITGLPFPTSSAAMSSSTLMNEAPKRGGVFALVVAGLVLAESEVSKETFQGSITVRKYTAGDLGSRYGIFGACWNHYTPAFDR